MYLLVDNALQYSLCKFLSILLGTPIMFIDKQIHVKNCYMYICFMKHLFNFCR